MREGPEPGWSPFIHKSLISWSSLEKSYWTRPPTSLQRDHRTENTNLSTKKGKLQVHFCCSSVHNWGEIVVLPCRDQLQHPVDPDLLDPSVGHRTHIGQVELLVHAQVKLVCLHVGEWGAKRTPESHFHCYVVKYTIKSRPFTLCIPG